MMMRTYIVARMVYDRGGHEPVILEMHEARNPDELAVKLGGEKYGWRDFSDLEEGHADGADGFVISELVNSKLEPILECKPA